MKVMLSTLLALSLFTLTQLAHATLQDNGDGTVTDLNSNLMWQRCSAPSEETACVSISPTIYNWDDALDYCNGLSLNGHTNWRLPNVKELHSILDVTKNGNPTIDIAIFPDTQTDYYWSATTFVDTPSMAWYVNFGIGVAMTSPLSKGNGQYVRCVR